MIHPTEKRGPACMLYSVQAGFLRQNITPALFPVGMAGEAFPHNKKAPETGAFYIEDTRYRAALLAFWALMTFRRENSSRSFSSSESEMNFTVLSRLGITTFFRALARR